jgi:preprotein translocase subunit SecG
MILVLLTILHLIICIMLIAIVLLQTGKGADMGAAFGGASQTLFGGGGPANFLNKITTAAAIVFMITSFALAVVSSRVPTSSKVLDEIPTRQEQPASQTTPAPATTSQEQSSSATTSAPSADTSANQSAPVTQEAPKADNPTPSSK